MVSTVSLRFPLRLWLLKSSEALSEACHCICFSKSFIFFLSCSCVSFLLCIQAQCSTSHLLTWDHLSLDRTRSEMAEDFYFLLKSTINDDNRQVSHSIQFYGF